MTSSELQNLLRRDPFVPFRIYVTDGTVHEIRHRELLWVGPATAMLVVPIRDTSDDLKPMMERTLYIDLRHVVKVESEEPQPTP